jgi:DnaJ domain
MPWPQMRDDPAGHYARLGLTPDADQAQVTAAFRGKARMLHPDVPGTGDAAAFIAVRQAYDVLSDPVRRAAYDRVAGPLAGRPAPSPSVEEPSWESLRHHFRFLTEPRLPRLSWMILGGVAVLACLGLFGAWLQVTSPPAPVRSVIRPNAPAVTPATPSEARALAFGALPPRLAGTANYYILPAAGPTNLWHFDAARDGYIAVRVLPPFTPVQALRLNRQTGLVEIRVTDTSTDFVEASRLYPGNALSARRAYCAYNAGPAPANGEILTRPAFGTGRLTLSNRTTQPAVVKFRDAAGVVVAAIFLGPQGEATLDGLPDMPVQTEFAIGELWSRACEGFAAGMRAQRIPGAVTLAGMKSLVIPPDADDEALEDVSDAAFERD